MKRSISTILRRRLAPLTVLSLALMLMAGRHAAAQLTSPPTGLQPAQLAVVVNDDDPDSVAIGRYYLEARGVPADNLVHVSIPGKPRRLDAAQFAKLREKIDSQLPSGIEAVLMVWTAPYQVECNSITSAYTLGFDPDQCRNVCGTGKPSPYFNAAPGLPFSKYRTRISMLLPTESVEAARDLIGRGMASGFKLQPAGAYYLITTQKPRNSRAPLFPPNARIARKQLTTRTLRLDHLEGAQDVMIYQTGMDFVKKLDTVHFLPGALADHLTSIGGDLLGNGQMSSLRWLEAGATASYGTVSEPCNYWQKFPHPTVLLKHYVSGATAIEAYWRSVAWPAQGVFIGEPLAAPYRR